MDALPDNVKIEKIHQAKQADSLLHCQASSDNVDMNNRVSSTRSHAAVEQAELVTVDSGGSQKAADGGTDLLPHLLESQVLRLRCVSVREAYPAYPVCRQLPRQPNVNGLVGRLDAYFGNVRVGVCIDTGATNSIISKEVWEQIKDLPGVVTNIRAPVLTMRGATGDQIPLDGLAHVYFRLGEFTYDADIHFGGLQGIDMLLGWDWLKPMNVLVDCGTSSVMLGPQQTLHFLD